MKVQIGYNVGHLLTVPSSSNSSVTEIFFISGLILSAISLTSTPCQSFVSEGLMHFPAAF